MSDDPFLSRWSRLKRASRGQAARKPGPAPTPATSPPESKAVPPAPASAEPQPLPPLESLTADSDYAPFMREGVEEALRRQALKKLLHDPRFNVMDGLDVYIDDYSRPDPLPDGWLSQLNQTARLGEYREAPEQPPQADPEAAPEAAAAGEERPVPPAEKPQVAEGLVPPDAAAPADTSTQTDPTSH